MRIQRACDQCNYRRVKCSHDEPCNHCRRHGIQCTYLKASRGREVSGRRITSLKRQRSQAFDAESNTLGQQPLTTDSSTASPDSSHYGSESSSSHGTEYKRSAQNKNVSSPHLGSSLSPLQYSKGSARPTTRPDPHIDQIQSQKIKPIPLSNPAFIPTSHLANFMELSFSKLAPDPTNFVRLPEYGAALTEPMLNPIAYMERNGFPDFESFVDLSLPSIMSSSARVPKSSETASVYSFRQSSVSDQTFTDDDSVSCQSEDAPPLSDVSLIPILALYFERIHPIMPIFTRSWLFSRIDKSHHITDTHFGAMLISLSSAVLVQPTQIGNTRRVKKSNIQRARKLLEQCTRMHCSSTLGDMPSIDAIMTSFYMFVCLSSIGHDDAAWLRLSESVTLGQLLKLHDPSAYEHIDDEERERRLRIYWLLTVTERAYALQRGHSIGFRGRPGASMTTIRRKFKIGQLDDFNHIQVQLFDSVDEDFVDCWNGRCAGPKCNKRDAEKALSLYATFSNDQLYDVDINEGLDSNGSSASSYAQMNDFDSMSRCNSLWKRTDIQKADVQVTRQWLLNRLWYICLSHGLITADASHHALRPDYPFQIARDTLSICDKLSYTSMEAHGLGFCEKLYDIVRTLVTVVHLFPDFISNVEADRTDDIADPAGKGNPNNNISGSEGYASSNAQMHLSHLLAGQGDTSSSHAIATAHDKASQPRITNSALSPNLSDTSEHNPTLLSPSLSPRTSPLQSNHGRCSISEIVNAYISVFQRLRSGNHPFLSKLLESVQCLNIAKDGNC